MQIHNCMFTGHWQSLLGLARIDISPPPGGTFRKRLLSSSEHVRAGRASVLNSNKQDAGCAIPSLRISVAQAETRKRCDSGLLNVITLFWITRGSAVSFWVVRILGPRSDQGRRTGGIIAYPFSVSTDRPRAQLQGLALSDYAKARTFRKSKSSARAPAHTVHSLFGAS